MANQTPRTGFEKWQDGIDRAVGNPKWDAWDCEIRRAVDEYNRHLFGVAGFVPLNWQLIKAMVWVETGAEEAEWATKPMQIGVPGDPGLAAFLDGNEGGSLVTPPIWKRRLTTGSARSVASHNIRAGIGYLLMRMANYEYRTVPAADPKIHEVVVKPGDSLEKIAKAQGSTSELLKDLNPTAGLLRPGQVLKYRKGSVQRVIVGWRSINTTSVALRYNSMRRDPNYANKLEYALGLVRNRKDVVCAQ